MPHVRPVHPPARSDPATAIVRLLARQAAREWLDDSAQSDLPSLSSPTIEKPDHV
jgi:hypothetical protein